MYKHYELLKQLTEVAETNDKPWEEFELKLSTGDHVIPRDIPQLCSLVESGYEWCRKPKEDKPMTDEMAKHLREIYNLVWTEACYDPFNDSTKAMGQRLLPHITALNDELHFKD